VLLPILNIYSIGIVGLSVGKLLLLLFIVYGLFIKQYSLPKFPRNYLLYFIYMFIIPFLYIFTDMTSMSDILYKSIGTMFFALSFGYAYRYLDYGCLVRIYEKSALICSVFFLIQEIFYFSGGTRILGIIPGLPIVNGENTNAYVDMQEALTRSTSFFLEPAHFAQYISMYLVIKLFADRDKFVDFSSFFASIILLLSRSGNGYFVLILCWSIYLLLCIVKRRYLSKVFLSIIVLMALVSVALNFEGNEILSSVISRKEELSTNAENTSGYIRIFSGYFFYNELPSMAKIFGIGHGRLGHANALYLNGIQQILIFGWIIGLFLFSIFLFGLMKNNSTIAKILVLVILLFHFIAIGYNSTVILLMFVIVSTSKTHTYYHNITK
jgi:hypothetical protein